MDYFDYSLQKLIDGENLSSSEAKKALNLVMQGSISPVKLASWITALKIKGEVSTEISGCAGSLLSSAVKLNTGCSDIIDIVGTGGDGHNTVNISTASAIIAASLGVKVAKHGNKAVSSRSGSADVLSSLGININITPEQMVDCIQTVGICFLFAPTLHPAMKYAAPVRRELGYRTIFNIIGPLCNPAFPKRALIGCYSVDLARLMVNSAKELGFEHVMVVCGNDGLDEITIGDYTEVFELVNGNIRQYKLNPTAYGINLADIESIRGGSPSENANTLIDLFKNKTVGPIKDVVVLNSAASLIVAGITNDWKQAISLSTEAIENGKAFTKLVELIKFTKNISDTKF